MKYHPSVFGLSKRLWLYAPIPGVIAAAVYSLTLSRGVTPGAAAALTAAAVGLTPPSGEFHPFFAWIARAVASRDVFALPIRMGLFSTFCAVLSAVLFYRLVSRLILFSAFEGERRSATVCDQSVWTDDALSPEEIRHNRRVFRIAVWGGLSAACALMSAAPTWTAATRPDHGFFDLLLALTSVSLLPILETNGRFSSLFASVFLFTLGTLESAAFLPLVPVYVFSFSATGFPPIGARRFRCGCFCRSRPVSSLCSSHFQ